MDERKNSARFAPLALAAATIVWMMAVRTIEHEVREASRPAGEEELELGGGDDAASRADWEWQRLHDPATGSIPEQIFRSEREFAKRIPTRESELNRLTKSANGPAVAAVTWSSRGPSNVGGRTRALGVDIANASNLLAGGVSGGMWRSTDNGDSWLKVTPSNSLQSVSCIVQDTRVGKQTNWYYGTGELIGNSAARFGILRGDGIFKSTDNGLSWSQLSATTTGSLLFDSRFKYVWDLAVDVSNAGQDEIYAAHFGGISRSTDGGTTWLTTLGANTNDAGTLNASSRNNDVAVTSTGIVYATMSTMNTNGGGTSSPDSGIWRSANGVNWSRITPPGFPGSYYRTVIGIAPSDPNVVYFLAYTPGGGFTTTYAGSPEYTSFWKYTDNGSGTGTWENRSANLPDFGGNVGSFANQGGYDLVVKVKPDNANFVILGGTNLYRSTDGFATTFNTTWIGGYSTNNDVSVYANHHPDQHAVVFHPTTLTTVFSSHDGGVSSSTNITAGGVTWASLNNGYATGQFYAIAVDHASTNTTYIGGLQDNGCWFVPANSSLATQELGGDGAFTAVADNRTSYYVSSQNGRTYRMLLDAGGNLTSFTRVDPTGAASGSYQFINPFILDPNNTDIMFMSNGGNIWRNSSLSGIPLSSNNTTATNWTNLTGVSVTGTSYTAIGASRTSPTRLYLGTSSGGVYRVDNASTGSPTKVDVFTSKGMPAGFVSSIAVDPSNADRALLTFSNYSILSLYSTTNAGSTWTEVGGNLEASPDGSGPGPSVRAAAILPFGGVNYYFVGTSIGLFSTTTLNGSSTVWAQEGATSIGNVVVDMVVARVFDGKIFVGTHGNGVFNGALSFTATIYPGDANNDKTVDVRDLLPIGQFFGATGAVRPSATTTWSPQSLTTPWSTANAWFADCNGDGVVNEADVTVLVTNWKATHSTAPPSDVDRRSVCEELLRALDGQAQNDATQKIRAALYGYLRNDLGVVSTFALDQNYPNPFNPSTSISFSLSESAASASLKIYDAQGKEVWSRSYTGLGAGSHHELWNGETATGARVASGVYVYQLSAGGKSLSRRMTLLK